VEDAPDVGHKNRTARNVVPFVFIVCNGDVGGDLGFEYQRRGSTLRHGGTISNSWRTKARTEMGDAPPPKDLVEDSLNVREARPVVYVRKPLTLYDRVNFCLCAGLNGRMKRESHKDLLYNRCCLWRQVRV